MTTASPATPTPAGGEGHRHTHEKQTHTHKQEKEEASPEIIEVAPGILRLQLPIDFTGLGHVNTYALEDGDGFALVDPGLPGEANWKVLVQRMDAAGIPLSRVHTVIVTHSHPDHFGGAGLLAEKAGARVVTSEHFKLWWDPLDIDDDELHAIDDDPADDDLPFPLRSTPWGGTPPGPPPEQRAKFLESFTAGATFFRPPRPTHRVADGEYVLLAGREWMGLFTPGHTDDHLCLFDPTEGVLLAGDQVLPTITPHVSGLIEGDSLALFVESLDRLAALDGVTTVLPAHGHPFTDLPGRVTAMKQHHDERLEEIHRISGGAGWSNVEDLSHLLFQPRSWGSMAESETYAHLEHLRLRHRAEVRQVGSKLEFLAR